MTFTYIFEWIALLGPLLISWPVVGIITLVFFRKSILRIIDQLLSSGITKAKFGPIEIEREIKVLTGKLVEQQVEQEKQKTEIETLRFLISNFVTKEELIHLEKLFKEGPFFYRKTAFFELELRRLRSLGLINNLPDKGIRTMAQEGNLKDYFFITDQGREYLDLRK